MESVFWKAFSINNKVESIPDDILLQQHYNQMLSKKLLS